MIVLMFMCMILFIRRHTYLFFFNAPSTTDLYTLSLHDALPIYSSAPFRNRSEAFDTAWLSQSLEQAKVPDAVLPDRKSTRLNSSHVAISYAVFCLKKKKKKTYINILNITIATSTPQYTTFLYIY